MKELQVSRHPFLCLAETHLVGNTGTEPGVFTTLTTTTVECLNVMNVLTADRIVLRMSSRHFMDYSEPTFTFLGSHIENLRLGGYPVEIKYDAEVLAEWDTFTKAKEGYRKRYPEQQRSRRHCCRYRSSPR